MTQALKRLGFFYKKAKRAPAKWDNYLESCFKLQYYLKSLNLSADESLYFMDESGFENNTKIEKTSDLGYQGTVLKVPIRKRRVKVYKGGKAF